LKYVLEAKGNYASDKNVPLGHMNTFRVHITGSLQI